MKVKLLIIILARANTSKNYTLSQGVLHCHLVSFGDFVDTVIKFLNNYPSYKPMRAIIMEGWARGSHSSSTLLSAW